MASEQQHRVLVVDDDRLTRWMFAIALQQKDIDVDVAESKREAIRLLDRNADRYCCVLLDLVLPDGDGVEVAAHIRNQGLEIPVIVVTGHPERQIGEHVGRVVRLVIRKPVEPQALSDYVHKSCPRQR